MIKKAFFILFILVFVGLLSLPFWLIIEPRNNIRIQNQVYPSTVIENFSVIDKLYLATISSDKAPSYWYRRLETPYKMTNPRSRLSDFNKFLSIKLGLFNPSVESYPENFSQNTCEQTKPYDPVWNRRRGVYQSKDAIFLPPKTTIQIPLPKVNKSAVLKFYTTATPLKANAPLTHQEITFVVSDGHHEIATYTLNVSSCASWFPIEIPISTDTNQITFRTHTAETPQEQPGELEPNWSVFIGNPVVEYEPPSTPKRPNLLWIVVDTLRKDALIAMPNLYQYAQHNTSFSAAFSNATWTRPSIMSMFSGKLPSEQAIGAQNIILTDTERSKFYKTNDLYLPMQTQANGYTTRAIGNNFFLLGYPQIGLDLGFPEVDDIRHPELDTNAITRGVINFLKKQPSPSPFFLYVHYDTPHFPYTPTSDCKTKAVKFLKSHLEHFEPSVRLDKQFTNYLGECICVDEQIQHILEYIDSNPALNSDTMVIITSDHGEVFSPEHNHFVVEQKQPTLYHHGWSAYDEVLHVPLIIHFPGSSIAQIINQNVQLKDLFPTVLTQLNLNDKNHPKGPYLFSQDTQSHTPIIAEGQNIRAIRDGNWVYLQRNSDIKYPNASHPVTVLEEVYDTQKDPRQIQNLISFQPDIVGKFKSSNPSFLSNQQLITIFYPSSSTLPISFSIDLRWIVHPNHLVQMQKKSTEIRLILLPGGSVQLKPIPTLSSFSMTQISQEKTPIYWGQYALNLKKYCQTPISCSITLSDETLNFSPPSELNKQPNALYIWSQGEQNNPSADSKISPEVTHIMKAWGYIPSK